MTGTLRSLLHQSLDYAGLFPPASLPMAEATAVFDLERCGPAASMISRFVCPVARLNELTRIAPNMQDSVAITAILRGGRTAGEFLANLEADLAALPGAAASPAPTGVVDTIEMRLPAEALAPVALRKLLAAIVALLGRQPGTTRQVFLEIAPSPELGLQLGLIAEFATPLRQTTGIGLGYKLRTGGSDAASIPSIPLVAAALVAADFHQLPMKCTGGLHHPLRGKHPGADHALHGFVNLLTAAAFACKRHAPSEVLESVLAEEQPQAFTFGADTLDWRNLSLTGTAITAARSQLLVSFGSCYADVPQTELRRLGWWE